MDEDQLFEEEENGEDVDGDEGHVGEVDVFVGQDEVFEQEENGDDVDGDEGHVGEIEVFEVVDEAADDEGEVIYIFF